MAKKEAKAKETCKCKCNLKMYTSEPFLLLFRILISGGKCGSPTLIKGGGKKGGGEM